MKLNGFLLWAKLALALNRWREFEFKAFVGFELKLASFWLWLKGWGLNLREKLALAFAVIFVATAVFCMS